MVPKYLFRIIYLFLILGCSGNNGIKLSGVISERLQSKWEFKNQKSDNWYPAKVPGTVHTDLLKNNLIPNPFFGLNEQKLQWIENENWEYRTTFDVPDKIYNKKHINLIFRGLDTYAEVRLNDSLIINADNMFRTWREDCKGLIKKSGNVLNIVFRSPIMENKAKFKSLPYQLPAGNDRSDLKVSVFARKAPYHFGWDWGPRFVTSGIWRPVEIEGWGTEKINDFQIYQLQVSEKKADLKAVIQIDSDAETACDITLLNGNRQIIKKKIHLRKGVNKFSEIFQINNPKLWWPNGLGKAYRYNLSVALSQNKSIIDQKYLWYGIRTIEVVQKPDSSGKSFYFKVNGVPVFMKGANYIPQDSFLPRVTKARYEKLILAAKNVNINMLRVWGGGVYEDDIFYDLCDENGILVWQDFMFACSMYPGDNEFLSNIKEEAVENVKRLRNHPCIALWCGNNEMQIAWERWGYQKAFGYSKSDSTKIYNDYLKIFHRILPDVVDSLDSSRFYWPSSPNSAPEGWEQEARSGDFHYWGVWWGKEPFSAYEKYVGRFVSEYGFQSIPSYYTIKSFAPDTSCYLVSPALKSHNKHPVGFETIDEYMKRDFNIPKKFKDYIIISQLLQAEGMKTAIEAHRRAMPYCMGTLYWQLNDCWPVVSWSSIDYFGRWKAFHYYLKKLYSPVLVSAVYKDGKLEVYLVSDISENRGVKLKMKLMDFFGKELWYHEEHVSMPANTSRVVFSKVFEDLQRFDKNKILFNIKILENSKVLAENNLYFAQTKNMNLPNPKITYKTVKRDGKFEVEVESQVFVKYVFIDYPDDYGVFSDNYFYLLPGEKKIIRIDLPNAEKEFASKMKIRTYPFN